jgi:hypothetical protein
MPVRIRRMKNSRKGVRLLEGSSSSEEDIEMSPSATSMVDELRSYLDTRIQERMEALNENARTEPPMVQKDDTIQLLLQILDNQDGRMKKLEQAMSNTDQNLVALIQGMSQKITTGGIEIGQGSGQQPQIEVITTNVDIPIGYPVNSTVGPKERPTNIGLNTPVVETHRVEQSQVEQIITESPRVEPPHCEPPRVESPQFEPPRVEQPRMEPPKVDPPRVEQPRVEPPRMEQLQFEPPRVDPPQFE